MEIFEKQSVEIRGRGGRRPGAGRPLGSPNRLTQPLKELASEYGQAALLTLAEIMMHGESETARIQASRGCITRARRENIKKVWGQGPSRDPVRRW